jgi:hypothetical protein
MTWLALTALLTLAGGAQHETYVLATVPAVTREDVAQLVSMDMEPQRWAQPGLLEVVARESVVGEALALGFDVTVLIADLESHYASQMSGRGDFGDYYTYSEAVTAMNQLHFMYPSITTAPESIGVGWENNVIWAMKLSDNASVDETEPEVLFTGAHHAREPIGVTLCLDWAELLCSNYGTDPLLTFYVDEREIWIIPVVNPDGYLYNEATNPNGGGMWRKNRRVSPGPVDLNRNYTYNWGYNDWGSSPYPGDETYRGPSAGSEPETQAIMAFCEQHEFTCAQNWHSYGNLLLYPWGYDDILTPDDEHFDRLAARATVGIGYQTGTSWEVLYNVNGDANDWMYGDELAKPKVFASTGEVGESFWQESQIPAHIQEGRVINHAFTMMAGPMPEYESHIVQDSGGDGRLDPGETGEITLVLLNVGFSEAMGVAAVLRIDDPFVGVVEDTTYFLPIPAVTSAQANTPFTVDVPPTCPDGYALPCSVFVSGQTAYPDTFLFSVGIGQPTVLVVDTDDEPTETRLMEAMALSGYSFDSWYSPTQGSVPVDTLMNYEAIVWTAADQNVSSMSATDRANMSQYLSAGGSLLFSAENYLTSYGSEPFTTDYLHVADYTVSVTVNEVSGVSGDPITDGMTMSTDFPGGMSNYPDEITPDALAAGILTIGASSDYTALRYPASGTRDYRVVFMATPFEALEPGLPDPSNPETFLKNALDWLIAAADTIPPNSIGDLAIGLGSPPTNLVLSWSPPWDNVGVEQYQVYRGTTAYFVPSPASLAGTVAFTTWTDIGGAGDPNVNHFYAVTALDAAENESPASNRVGETDFSTAMAP